jgi:hypothetical protein
MRDGMLNDRSLAAEWIDDWRRIPCRAVGAGTVGARRSWSSPGNSDDELPMRSVSPCLDDPAVLTSPLASLT